MRSFAAFTLDLPFLVFIHGTQSAFGCAAVALIALVSLIALIFLVTAVALISLVAATALVVLCHRIGFKRDWFAFYGKKNVPEPY